VQAQAAHTFVVLLGLAIPHAELRRDAMETRLPRFAEAMLANSSEDDVEVSDVSGLRL
jgi:hypothetical protein